MTQLALIPPRADCRGRWRQIAQHFGKRHADVIRAVRKLECSAEFRERNFAFIQKTTDLGKNRTRQDLVCNITRDGFVFLAMGFTGKEAAQWKEAYITAFNRMESELSAKLEAEPSAGQQDGRILAEPGQGVNSRECLPHAC